jgi:hypothetical protein
MGVAITAGTTTVHRVCIPGPSCCRRVAPGDPYRRSAGPTTAHRIILHRPVGSGHRDSVASARRGPLRPSTGDDLAGAAAVSRSSSGPHPRPTSFRLRPRHPFAVVCAGLGGSAAGTVH